MSTYWNIRRNASSCVHFIYADEMDETDWKIPAELARIGLVHIYVDYLRVKHDGQHIANALAGQLKLDHAPYPLHGKIKIWVPFSDDLATVSHRVNGLAIIIDNADDYLRDNSREMFELTEDFLLQFHHWFEKKKPCHLCFQMEKDSRVKRIFGPGSTSS